MCTKMGEMRSLKWDQDVFGVNCLEATRGALEGFDFVDGRKGELKREEEERVERLVEDHVRVISLLSFVFSVACAPFQH